MDFHNRQYDPQLGRFLGVDALAGSGGQQVLSPYHAMACNPAMMVDPFGLRSDVFDNGARPIDNTPRVSQIIPMNTNARYILLDQMMYADQAAFHQDIRDRMEAEAEGEEASKESETNGNSSNNSSSAAGNGAQAKSGESDEQSSEDESKNESTQQKVLFFKNEQLAYNYLVVNTKFNLDKNVTPRPVENFAYVTKEGVYVLPISGLDLDGKEFRNYANSAEWRILNYKIDKNGMSIKYSEKWSKVLATVHTHPGLQLSSVPSHSGEDRGIARYQGTMSIVFSLSNVKAYGIYPGGNYSVPISNHLDFRNGTISIIRHYNQLVQFLKQ